MRVVGPAPMGGEFVEIVMEEAPLRRPHAAMRALCDGNLREEIRCVVIVDA